MTDLGMVEGTDYTFLPVGDGGTAAVAFLRDEVNCLCRRGVGCGDPGVARADPARDHARGLSGLLRQRHRHAGKHDGRDAGPCARSSAARWCAACALPPTRRTRKRRWPIAPPATRKRASRTMPRRCIDGVVDRMTPTDAFIGQGYGYQPPEHWQAIHDSAVASGALEAAAARPVPRSTRTNSWRAGTPDDDGRAPTPDRRTGRPPVPHGRSMRSRRLSKTYARNKLTALTDVNLTLHKGEFVSVVGSSGCGKSTLAEDHVGAHATHHRPGRAGRQAGHRPARRHRHDVPASNASAVENHRRKHRPADRNPAGPRRRPRRHPPRDGPCCAWSAWAISRMSIRANCRAAWRSAPRSAGC